MTEISDKKMPVRVTREQLYAQVWETPMRTLAQRYGISDNGLAKICTRLNVPYPPRGYWAKKTAGKKVIHYKLPEPDKSIPPNVLIRPTPVLFKSPEQTQEDNDRIEEAKSLGETLRISERLSRPHAVIAKWLADQKKLKQDARQEQNPWMREFHNSRKFKEIDHRAHRILDALFKELERRGCKVGQEDGHGVKVELEGEKIEVQMREKSRQVRVPIPDDRKYLYSKDKTWMQELQPTGKLIFAIKTYLPQGLRTEWLETDQNSMEALLPEIIITIMAAGPCLAERTRQHQEAERQARIAEQNRHQKQQEEQLESNRWRRFVELADQQREVGLARRFLASIQESQPDMDKEISGKPLRAWIEWAEESINTHDPMVYGAESIFDSIASVTIWSYNKR